MVISYNDLISRSQLTTFHSYLTANYFSFLPDDFFSFLFMLGEWGILMIDLVESRLFGLWGTWGELLTDMDEAYVVISLDFLTIKLALARPLSWNNIETNNFVKSLFLLKIKTFSINYLYHWSICQILYFFQGQKWNGIFAQCLRQGYSPLLLKTKLKKKQKTRRKTMF